MNRSQLGKDVAATVLSMHLSLFRTLATIHRVLGGEVAAISEAVVRHWPGLVGYAIRRLYYRHRFKHLGRRVRIAPGVRFLGHRHISIDDDTFIDYGVQIIAGPPSSQAEVCRLPNPQFDLAEGEVRIGKATHVAVGVCILGQGGVSVGDYCGIAGGSRILSCTHHYSSSKKRFRRDIYFSSMAGADHVCYIVSPVVIGNNAGVASNCILLPGTRMGDESFLGVASVVPTQGVVGSNRVACGNPAVEARYRFPSTVGQQLQRCA
jgi:acetyltransferase-like isoleucine patch superfamily enzyme